MTDLSTDPLIAATTADDPLTYTVVADTTTTDPVAVTDTTTADPAAATDTTTTDTTVATTADTTTTVATTAVIASVATDGIDYAPGSTATIYASGFGIGDSLTYQITVIDPTTGDALWTVPSWDGTSDSSGFALTNFYFTGDFADTTILLTVTDAITGQVATEVFTDKKTITPPELALLAVNAAVDPSTTTYHTVTASDLTRIIHEGVAVAL